VIVKRESRSDVDDVFYNTADLLPVGRATRFQKPRADQSHRITEHDRYTLLPTSKIVGRRCETRT